MNYAGFWLRFVAIVIDAIILGVVNWLILVPILGAMGITAAGGFPFSGMSPDEVDIAELVAMLTAMIGVAWVVQRALDVLYHSFMETSKFQGSVGKIALGLKVTDTSGEKLDFTKAVIRNICKIISGMILLIGYIMAGFTDKKQGLHDMIAGTVVVKK